MRLRGRKCRRGPAGDPGRPPGPRSHRVRADEIGEPAFDDEGAARPRCPRRSFPRHTTLVHDRNTPWCAGPAVIDLELHLEAAVAGSQPQLRGRPCAAAPGSPHLGASVLSIARKSAVGEDERRTEGQQRRRNEPECRYARCADRRRGVDHGTSVRAGTSYRNRTLVPVAGRSARCGVAKRLTGNPVGGWRSLSRKRPECSPACGANRRNVSGRRTSGRGRHADPASRPRGSPAHGP